MFFNRFRSFATRRNWARVERLGARPQKTKRPNQTQRDKRRGLKVSNAFFDGSPDLPDDRQNALQTQRNSKLRNAFQRFSPSSSRRRHVPSETTTSRQTNRFSRVPSRPPLLLTPRLEATCGTKVSRVVASKSSRRPFSLPFRKFPCRRELQAPLPRFQTFFNIFKRRRLRRKSALRRSGRRRDESDAPRRNAVERSNLRPFGIKGYFGANRPNGAANALKIGRREIVGKSRQSRRRSGRKNGTPFHQPRTVEATPIDANCGTARRTAANRKSRSRSAAARPVAGFDNKVPCFQTV